MIMTTTPTPTTPTATTTTTTTPTLTAATSRHQLQDNHHHFLIRGNLFRASVLKEKTKKRVNMQQSEILFPSVR